MKYRDLQLIEIDNNNYLTVACDSCGGVGLKTYDTVKVNPEITGYFTARVVLLETLAVGGEVISLINTLSVEMEDTGKRIINGIKDALNEANIKDTIITGSTEENFLVETTGIGMTIIGKVPKIKINNKKINNGDLAITIGLPKFGNELVNDELILKKQEIFSINDLPIVHQYSNDCIPVGSKGIKYECELLAKEYKLNFELTNMSIDVNKSAGPATTLVVAITEDNLKMLQKKIKTPINIVGKFNA